MAQRQLCRGDRAQDGTVPNKGALNLRICDSPAMTAPHTEWTVLPHGTLQRLEDSILTVTGTAKMPIGEFERRMTIVRLSDGRLILYSPVALDEDQMRRIESLRPPRVPHCSRQSSQAGCKNLQRSISVGQSCCDRRRATSGGRGHAGGYDLGGFLRRRRPVRYGAGYKRQ